MSMSKSRSLRTAASLLSVIAAAFLCAACTPRLVARGPAMVNYAAQAPAVEVLPILDQRAEKLHVSTGYVGIFQSRQEIDTGADTAPAQVVGDALASELAQRGHTGPGGAVQLGCTMPGFLLRFRNYAGAYSATDSWGYLDLICQIRRGEQVLWQGPVHARHHRVSYVFMSSFPDAIWPELTGALVQQAAAILNREFFHQAASPAIVQKAMAMLATADADQRYLGAYTLGITGDPAVIPLVLPLLDDPDKKVRRSAADALGTLGARQAMPMLIQRFDTEDGNVQWATIKAILQTNDPQGFDWLRGHAAAIKADTLIEIVEDVLAHEGR